MRACVCVHIYMSICVPTCLQRVEENIECPFLSTPPLRQVSQVLEFPVFQLCGAPEILPTLSPTMLESKVCVSLHPFILVGAEHSP